MKKMPTNRVQQKATPTEIFTYTHFYYFQSESMDAEVLLYLFI